LAFLCLACYNSSRITIPHPYPRTNPDRFLSKGRLAYSGLSYCFAVIACILKQLFIYIGLYESSTPPAIITFASLSLIYFVAWMIADRPDAHAVLTVRDGPVILYLTLRIPVGILVMR
jgi:hypothetical protein